MFEHNEIIIYTYINIKIYIIFLDFVDNTLMFSFSLKNPLSFLHLISSYSTFSFRSPRIFQAKKNNSCKKSIWKQNKSCSGRKLRLRWCMKEKNKAVLVYSADTRRFGFLSFVSHFMFSKCSLNCLWPCIKNLKEPHVQSYFHRWIELITRLILFTSNKCFISEKSWKKTKKKKIKNWRDEWTRRKH